MTVHRLAGRAAGPGSLCRIERPARVMCAAIGLITVLMDARPTG